MAYKPQPSSPRWPSRLLPRFYNRPPPTMSRQPSTGESAPHDAANVLGANRDERCSSGSRRRKQHRGHTRTRSDKRLDAGSGSVDPCRLLHLLYTDNNIRGSGTNRSSPHGLLGVLYTSNASHVAVSFCHGPRACRTRLRSLMVATKSVCIQ